MNRTSRLWRAYRKPAVAIAGVMLVGMALRAPMTGIVPLLEVIRKDLHLGATAAGMLTTLPLLAFALISLLAPVLARRYGLERSLFGAMVLMVLGVALRSAGSAAALFAGTAAAGAGIAIGNVLLPSLLKRDFPERAAAWTAIYVLAMSIAAGAASALAVPMAAWSGSPWRFSAAVLLVAPLLAGLAWAPHLLRRRAASGRRAAVHAAQTTRGHVWRSALAWQVTGYLGLNSFVFYVCIGWLPQILVDAGSTPAEAGALHGLLQLMSVVPALLVAPLLRHLRDQRAVAAAAALMNLVGLAGLMTMPALNQVWVVLLGLGTSAGVIFGLAFVTLRTGTPQLAAALSGMAQCVGYLFASVGPVVVGALHDAAGSWDAALLLCMVFSALMALAALGAGRDRQIDTSKNVPGAAEPSALAGTSASVAARAIAARAAAR